MVGRISNKKMSKKTIQYVDDKGKESKLPEVFLNLEPNVHLLHLSVLRQLNNKRSGTASTKTRSEVRGGGKKPWRQKGTGRARVGSIRSPLWVGGGIAFGPKPRSYEFAIPQKARNLAIAQAITSKIDDLMLLKKLPDLKSLKTKDFVASMKSLGLTKTPLLLICESGEPHYIEVKKASNNLPYVMIKDQKYVGTVDILKANTVVITEHALNELGKRFSDCSKNKKKKSSKAA